jgi:cytochrome c
MIPRVGPALLLGLAGLVPVVVPAAEEEARIPPEASVCLGCHTVDEAGRRGADAAPSLWGVVGRSAEVAGLEGRWWTPRALNRWLANPRAMAPRSASRFPGLADPEARRRVVEFLQTLE